MVYTSSILNHADINLHKTADFIRVPVGIEPFVSVYSNPLSDCTFVTLSFIKAIELALH